MQKQVVRLKYRVSEITKGVYNNTMSSINHDRMDAIFINSENSQISETYRLLLNIEDKINLKKSDKYVPLSNCSMSVHGT